MRKKNTRLIVSVREVLRLFGDVTQTEALKRLTAPTEPQRRGVKPKWDDGVDEVIYLWMEAALTAGIGKNKFCENVKHFKPLAGLTRSQLYKVHDRGQKLMKRNNVDADGLKALIDEVMTDRLRDFIEKHKRSGAGLG